MDIDISIAYLEAKKRRLELILNKKTGIVRGLNVSKCSIEHILEHTHTIDTGWHPSVPSSRLDPAFKEPIYSN